jgi:prepilin-type N-terminal cleavage/methylation domain-containing protein
MDMTAARRDSAPTSGSEQGFTLIELMITTVILMVVSGVAIKGVLDMSRLGDIVSNRTDMHSGVRNATELLTQEVGQAGRITLPGAVALSAATALADTTFTVNSTAGMFQGMLLTVDAGTDQETVTVANAAAGTVTLAAGFNKPHPVNAPVAVLGGFASGVVPDDMGPTGSGPWVLKIYGDIVGDGNMVYVEYVCDIAAGRLYRNMMDFDEAVKPPTAVDKVLIDNIVANPDNMDCFRYQRKSAGGQTYIVDVAITLTVESQHVDERTGKKHTESKALLNVSPRNVFNVWQLAGMGITNRIQPMPPSVQQLLEDIP